MHRFFVSPRDVHGETLSFAPEESRHMAKVLRLKAGEKIIAFDGTGMEYEVELTEASPEGTHGRILTSRRVDREAPIQVWLVQGLPKGDKMELILQKGTELGMAGLVPVGTRRAVVQLEGKKAADRRERWQKVASEAARQCRRNVVPRVEEIIPLSRWVSRLPEGAVVLVLWEEEGSRGLKETLCTLSLGDRPLYLVIGPEGGLDPAEVEGLKAKGALTVTLGPRILRTETAGMAGLAMILYELGDLGG